VSDAGLELLRAYAADHPLTKRQRWVLEQLRDGGEEAELVYEPGAGGWLDLERIAPRTVFALVRLTAVSLESESQDVGRKGCLERYVINSFGRELLEKTPVRPRR
jgi:hypothetical protein